MTAPSRDNRQTPRTSALWAPASRPEWLDGVLILTGMIAWSISQTIPVEFLWSSTADCGRLMYG